MSKVWEAPEIEEHDSVVALLWCPPGGGSGSGQPPKVA
jgi:hypothetical protein